MNYINKYIYEDDGSSENLIIMKQPQTLIDLLKGF